MHTTFGAYILIGYACRTLVGTHCGGDMSNEENEEQVRWFLVVVGVSREYAHASTRFSVWGFAVFNAMFFYERISSFVLRTFATLRRA